jgi:pyrimidine operon attenuation protein/uracil phosphoribosyltransferase
MTTEVGSEVRTLIMSADDMRRALTRMSHELVERNEGPAGLVLVGIRTRCVPLARRVANLVCQFEGVNLPYGGVDITLYRESR